MAVHTGERSHLCAECGRSFASVSTLIDHRKRKHLEMRDHKCPECPKAFFARQDLESHRRTHTGDKPFQCTVRKKSGIFLFRWRKIREFLFRSIVEKHSTELIT